MCGENKQRSCSLSQTWVPIQSMFGFTFASLISNVLTSYMCSVVYFYPVNYVACCVVFTYLDTMHSAFCIESIIMAGCLTDLKTYVKKTEYRHSSEPSIWYQCYLTLQGTTKCSTLSNRNTYQRKAYALSFFV